MHVYIYIYTHTYCIMASRTSSFNRWGGRILLTVLVLSHCITAFLTSSFKRGGVLYCRLRCRCLELLDRELFV